MVNFCWSTKTEKIKPLPGDNVVPAPTIASTHAITIDVPAEKVWPWIVQIGQDRGGFYSFTLLENLMGCRMRNADQINPDWQHLILGDAVALHPKFPPLRVKEISPADHLVLWQETRFIWTWAFVMIRISPQQTRLIVRTRFSTDRWAEKAVLYPVMTLGHYVMERKMLTGIKQRSERT